MVVRYINTKRKLVELEMVFFEIWRVNRKPEGEDGAEEERQRNGEGSSFSFYSFYNSNLPSLHFFASSCINHTIHPKGL